jgi:hypothetical protein
MGLLTFMRVVTGRESRSQRFPCHSDKVIVRSGPSIVGVVRVKDTLAAKQLIGQILERTSRGK